MDTKNNNQKAQKSPSESTTKMQENANPIKQTNEATTVKSGGVLNPILWILALSCFIGSTVATQWLSGNWAPANNIWVRIGITVGLVVLGLVFLLLTQQGKTFPKLLSDSRIELRRVTWPSKEETTEYTWKVLLVLVLSGVLIWFLDGIASLLISPLIK